MKDLWRKIKLFFLIGILNVVIDFGILNVLLSVFGLHYAWSYPLYKGISFCVACVNSYFLNATFTFKSNTRNAFSFGTFFAVTVLGFVLNVTVATVLYHYLKSMPMTVFLQANISALVGTGIAMIWNFIFYNYVIFRQKN